MSARLAAVLVVLLVVLGGGALLVLQRGAGDRPAAAGSLGQPLLKGLKAADVSAIAIRDAAGALTLARSAEQWAIAERAGFPADIEKVRELVVKAIELKVGQSEPIAEKDRARLALDDKGATVEFRGAEGKPLAQIVVGKKYFKSEPDRPETARGDGRFVLLPEDAKTVYIVSDPLALATSRTSEWISRGAFTVEKVKSLEVRHPDGDGWRIEREADNADWKLAGAKPGEKLAVTRANAASYSLSILELADVAPKDAKDTGLDRAVVVNATTLDGLAYAIRVGRLEGENHYVRFSLAGALRKERAPERNEKAEDRERRDKEHAERIRKIEERLPREKMLSEHVLLVPKSKLEDVLKKRADLLEQKEDKKK
jgi:hypothetical protein